MINILGGIIVLGFPFILLSIIFVLTVWLAGMGIARWVLLAGLIYYTWSSWYLEAAYLGLFNSPFGPNYVLARDFKGCILFPILCVVVFRSSENLFLYRAVFWYLVGTGVWQFSPYQFDFFFGLPGTGFRFRKLIRNVCYKILDIIVFFGAALLLTIWHTTGFSSFFWCILTSCVGLYVTFFLIGIAFQRWDKNKLAEELVKADQRCDGKDTSEAMLDDKLVLAVQKYDDKQATKADMNVQTRALAASGGDVKRAAAYLSQQGYTHDAKGTPLVQYLQSQIDTPQIRTEPKKQ